MPLTDTTIKNLRPTDKTRKVYDALGLYLEVPKKSLPSKPDAEVPCNKKQSHYRWRFKYLFNRKEQVISLGQYPEVTLAEARTKRTDFRALVAKGINPSEARKEMSAQIALDAAHVAKVKEAEAFTLRVAALAWTEANAPKHAPITTKRRIARFNTHLFPLLGDRPLDQIKAQDLRLALQAIQSASRDFAHRLLVDCKAVWREAKISGKVSENVALELESKQDLLPIKGKHHKAITDPSRLAVLLQAIEDYKGNPILRAALRIAPFVFVRPGELRLAEWQQIDWDARTWTFTTAPNKGSIEHIVPLAEQVMIMLTDLRATTDGGAYVFGHFGTDKKPLSEAALGNGIKRLGFGGDTVPHGFRATARTLLSERLEVSSHLIERQLAHVTKEANGAAYDRALWIKQRTNMMQDWANYLEALRTGNNVIPITQVKKSA